MFQLAILPGPNSPKDMDTFLKPIVDELRVLSSTGLTVRMDGEEVCRAKVHLVMATGDIPAVADLCHHAGHMSTYGCRICLTKTVKVDHRSCYLDYKADIRPIDNYTHPERYNQVSFFSKKKNMAH